MIIAVNNDGMSGQDLSIDCLKIDKKIKFHQQQCMNYLKMFCLTKRGICVLKLKVEYLCCESEPHYLTEIEHILSVIR